MMDDEIWKDLPEEVVEAVIARVPIAAFFRFHSVCRRWNSLLSCESFYKQCSQVKHAKPWFYTTYEHSGGAGALYDPSLRKWYHPTLPTESSMLSVASAGGLICFYDYTRFYMCNPVTRSFRELPATSEIVNPWPNAIGMMSMRVNGGYKIIFVGNEGEYQVFDSSNNSWIRPRSMPSCIKLPLGLKHLMSQSVEVEGRMYFMRSEPDGILSYEVDTGIWRQYQIPAPHHMIHGRIVADSGGRIMLVGMLMENEAMSICVWELHKMCMLWKEVDKMPHRRGLEFRGSPFGMACLGNQTMLMISFNLNRRKWLFTYDLSTGEWLELPGYVPSQSHARIRKTQWIYNGVAFHPCLTALP